MRFTQKTLKLLLKQLSLKNNEVWLAGKGPSLDKFDWTRANPFRIGINETALIIPDCFGAVACDANVINKYHNLNKNTILFLRHDEEFKEHNTYIWYNGVEVTIQTKGTAAKAIQILNYLGFTTFHMVGFDAVRGESGYAKKIIDINGQGLNSDSYKEISKEILSIINKLNIEVIWEN